MLHGLKTRLITSTEEFAACRSEWNELAGTRLFHRWEWMFHWWKHFGAGSHLAIVVVVNSNGKWMGIAPWYKSASASRGRVVRQLASGSACSDYTSIATRAGCENAVARVLADMILNPTDQPLFHDVDLYELEGHVESDQTIAALSCHLQSNGAVASSREISGTWEAKLPDTWDEFSQRISKSFRRKTKKACSRLNMDEIKATVARSPGDIVQAWPVFVELHQRRRTSLNETGCFAGERFEMFLREATLSLSDTGHAHINIAWLNDRPIAANLEFTLSNAVFMYQSGQDPELSCFEPGHLVFTWAIQNAIKRGDHSFDFLRGDEPYKARWNAVRIPLMRTRIVPNRISSRLRNGLWNAGRSVRTWTRAKPVVRIETNGEANAVPSRKEGAQ